MLGWSRSNSSVKPAKAKTSKPSKAEPVFSMPRKRREFGMGTFGSESDDTTSATIEKYTECPVLSLPKISDQIYDGDINDQDQNSENKLFSEENSIHSTNLNNQLQEYKKSFSNPDELSFQALQQHNIGFVRRDQLATPLKTPNTPSSTGLTTPHSIQSSYFPATPASGNTVSTNATSISFRSPSTAIFGNCNDNNCTEGSTSIGLNNGEQQPPTTVLCSPEVPETKKLRNIRPEIPPAIVTNTSLGAQRLRSQSTSQTPSTSHTPVLFTGRGYQNSVAISGARPKLTGTTAAAAPKNPNSVSEWRMMQMQLQQQDDLHFSLSLPSVSALSFTLPSTGAKMTGSSPIGHSHISASATSAPASSSGCSCCYSNHLRSSPSANIPVPGESTGMCLIQSPASAAPTFGNLTPGPDSATQHHSFLFPLNPQGGSKSSTSHRHPLYNHYNTSASSSDYFLSRDVHAEEIPHGHGLVLSQIPFAGSNAALHSEYAPSSVDPSEYDQAISSNCPSYGPSSAGSEAPLNHIGNYPYLRSAPASAVGGNKKTKYRKDCPQKRNSRRPSLGTTTFTSSSQAPITPAVSGPALVVMGGGVDMEVSTSSTSLTGSSHSGSRRRESSPSLGSFKSLSSKLAVSTMRKLSISQRSIFGSSKDDFIGTGAEYKCSHKNMSHDSISENITEAINHMGGQGSNCCQYHNLKGCNISAGGSACSDGEHSFTGSNKVRRQSKLNALRGVTGSKRGRKERNRRSARRSYEMEYNFSNHFVRQEFAQYNYERQIEDFQRAAKVFNEQRALTDAAAAAALVAEARAAVAEAAAEAAAIEKQDEEDLLDFPSPSQIPEAEIGESTQNTETRHNTDSLEAESITAKGRKKSIATSTRSGLLGSISRSQRRVGTGTIGTGSSTTTNTEGLESPKKSNTSIFGSSPGSTASSLHQNIEVNIKYPEFGHVNTDMESELEFSLLQLGHSVGLNSKNFGAYNLEESIAKSKRIGISHSTSNLDVRMMIIQDNQNAESKDFDDIPLNEIAPSPLPIFSPKKLDNAHMSKGRSSNISIDAGNGASSSLGYSKAASKIRTGRSVHSVCSVDTVSQQIAARHHQHSRLAASSNVTSLYSQTHVPMNSVCETLGTEGRDVYTAESTVILENSPIQVVRATVGTIDDPSLPCFTFRMWVLSTIFVVMGAAISEYNFFRSNSAYFSIYFVQLASYFCGKAMARLLPTKEFEIRIPCARWAAEKWSKSSKRFSLSSRASIDENEIGINSDNSGSSANVRRIGTHSSTGPIRGTNRSGLCRSNIASISRRSANGGSRYSWRFTLNPGKFNMKEHMLIGVAAAAGCSPAYATNIIAIQSLVFSSPLGKMTGIGLVVSSQFIGFSLAWFLFDFVIKPSVMVWPATLVNVSLYNTLHEHKVLTRWFTRMQLFWYAFFAIFIYQWLPRLFMPVLTSMALLCWIKPSSNVLRKLGSGYTGLGIGCISLDWSIVSGVGPLYTPWWAQCNFFVGLIGMLWIITPIVYFTNYWSAMSYPIVSSNLYDNATNLYDISKIVNNDLSFNDTMYESYSPVIMTPYFAITYGTSFMAVSATFVHVALYYGSDIWFITKTRCSRKFVHVRNSPYFQFVTVLFQNSSGPNVDIENVSAIPAMTTATMNSGEQSNEFEYGFIAPDKRKSESKSTRKDMDSSLGFRGDECTGLESEDLDGFHQSSNYHQLSQPQDCSNIPQTARPSAKSRVDERDQIPTEMFGVEDIHTSLMRAYPEIPGWWFGLMFVVCFVMAVFVCNTPEVRLPVYSLIIALLLAVIFALPMAIIQALSSSQIGLNVLSEVVCGYLLPGNQLGNSVFKCYSYMSLYQCLNLTQGFKLGHYMKVPPRKIFIAVIYGTLIGAFVNLQVLDWVLTYNRQALFDSDPRSGWSFRNLDLFFSASLLWGAISPIRLFGKDSIYHLLPYCFVIGLLLPVPFYVLYRHFPPFGAMCKGDSPIPFLPDCKCPASHIAASSEGNATATVVYPKRRGSEFDNIEDSGDALEIGRPGITFSNCWPFGRTRKSQEYKSDKTSNTQTGPAVLSPSLEDTEIKNQGNQVPKNRNHPEFIPHTYYGNPDGAWDHHLRRFPWHLINMPLICVGASFVPQAPASFVVSAGIVAFCFAFLVLRFRHEWWRRYTFVLAAALDAGTQICNMAVFVVFSLILKGSVEFPSWFGNDATNPEKCGIGDGYN